MANRFFVFQLHITLLEEQKRRNKSKRVEVITFHDSRDALASAHSLILLTFTYVTAQPTVIVMHNKKNVFGFLTLFFTTD